MAPWFSFSATIAVWGFLQQLWYDGTRSTTRWLNLQSALGEKSMMVETVNIHEGDFKTYHHAVDLSATGTTSVITGTVYNGTTLRSAFQSVSVDATGQYIVTGTSGGILYVSMNSGKTFKANNIFNQSSATLFPDSVKEVSLAINSPNLMLISTTNGYYTSTDFGITLQKGKAFNSSAIGGALSANGQIAYVLGYSTQSYAAPHVFKSSNSLSSFTLLASAPSDYYSDICISSDGQVVYLISNYFLYVSMNAGVTWTTRNLPNSYSTSKIACSANGQYLAIASNTVYISSNYGQSYTTSTGCCGTYSYYNLGSVSMSASGQYIAAGTQNDLIYFSSNYGQSFAGTYSGGEYWTGLGFTASNTIVAVSSPGYVVQSTNFGNTWTPSAYAFVAVASSQNGAVRLAITGSTSENLVFITTNSGASWTQISSIPSVSWLDVACDSTCTNIALGGYGGYLYHSNNGGATFSGSSIGVYYGYIAGVSVSSNGQIMYATDNSGSKVLVSTDYGKSFSKTNSNSLNWWRIASSSDGQYVFASTYQYGSSSVTGGGQLYYSANSGGSWILANNLPQFSKGIALACSSSGKFVVAAAQDETLYISMDYGVSWVLIPNTQQPWTDVAVSSDGSIMYAVSGGAPGNTSPLTTGAVYVSTNYGTSWTKLSAAPSVQWSSISCDSTGQNLIASVYYGQVYESSNGGSSWKVQSIAMTSFVSAAPYAYYDDDWSDDGLLKGGVIAGIVIGSLCCCGIIGGLIFVLLLRKPNAPLSSQQATADVELQNKA